MWRVSAGVLEQPQVDLRSSDRVLRSFDHVRGGCAEGRLNFRGALVLRSVMVAV